MVLLFRHLYWENSGRSLDQEGVYVTSRSGALRKLIFEDTCSQVIWTFLILIHLCLIMIHSDRQHDVLLLDVDRCYWLNFDWVCRVFDLEDAEASVEPPWNPDWVRECAIWGWFIYCDISLIWWYDVDMFWHDCWWCRLTIACRPDSHME